VVVVELVIIVLLCYADYLDDDTSDLQEEGTSKQSTALFIPMKKSRRLNLHVRNHPGARKFTCEICKKSFSSSCSLRRHRTCMHRDEAEQQYKCKVCRRKFTESADLHVHNCSRLTVRCSVCKEQFSRLDDLQQHMSNSHKDLSKVKHSFTCEMCKQQFHSLLDFKCHRKQQVHNFTEKPNFCLFCEEQFSRRDDLEVHTCSRAYTCTLCNQTFINTYELKNHMHVHNRDRILICKACNKQFKFLNNAIRHMHVHNGTQLFSCDVCGEKFRRVDSLKQHRSHHSSEGQFTCNICQEKYTNIYTFIQHRVSHRDQVPYYCDYCSDKFSDKHSLEVHMNSHTEEISFTCILCRESFINRCELKSHMQIHRSEETSGCNVCSKKFKNRSNLVRHMRDRHTGTKSSLSVDGERQFVCDICGKQFLMLTKLESHRRIHYGKEENASDASKKQMPDSHRPISLTLLSNHHIMQEDIQQYIVSSVNENQIWGSQEGTQEQITDKSNDRYDLCRSKDRSKSHSRFQQQAPENQAVGSCRFVSDEQHTCSICNMSFVKFDQLVSHLNIHRHVETFTCNICSKEIKRCSNFIRHMRLHCRYNEIICSVGEQQIIYSQESNQQHVSSSICENQSIGSKRSLKSQAGIQQLISSTVKDIQGLDSNQLVSVSDITYTCSVCSESFINFGELVAHLHTHRHIETFACNVCFKQIKRCSNFIRHMRLHFSKNGTLSCSQLSSQQHISSVGPKHRLKSQAGIREQISSTVNDNQGLGSCQLASVDDTTYTCSVCSATFVNFGKLEAHLHTHRHVETFTCNICSKHIMRCSNFIRHMRMHICKQLFSCGVCGKTSYRSDLMSNHMLSHADENQSACGSPSENVIISSAVEQQEPSSENEDSSKDSFEAHKCTNYNTQQTSSNAADKHILFSNQLSQEQISTDVVKHTLGAQQVISNRVTYACSVCSKKCTKFPELEAHLHVHRHDKVFTCNVCSKQIRHCNNFIRHMRIHYCTPPFCCGICGMRSHHGYDIKKHMLIHTGEQSFSCDDCGKKFARESYLRLHKCSHR